MSSAESPPLAMFPEHASEAACPACLRQTAVRFYEARKIPVHSCVLLDDQATALGFPRGDLTLAHCRACGFIFNDSFDARRLDYSQDYEETQAYSPTFNAFLESTVERLVEHHGWRNGEVLEIGCGRGDFLSLICTRGSNHGLGVDPSETAGRIESDAGLLRFRKEPYGQELFDERPSYVASRHTLEHLPQVAHVLATIRAHMQRSGGSQLFIEVPDVRRILEEGAFWDLYYEHCSYFSAGSLARLARQTGFEVVSLETVYGGQYLQLVARPAPIADPAPAEFDDLDQIADAVARFREVCPSRLERLEGALGRAAAAGQRVALWGGGSKATGLLTTLRSAHCVTAVVDVNPAKRGRYIAGAGHRMLAPEDLLSERPDKIFVMNPLYLEEIQAQLAELGITAEVAPINA